MQWSWDQISLRPTFYSYFRESFSGKYHIYIYMYVCILKLMLKYTVIFHLNTYNLDSKPSTYNKYTFCKELYGGFAVSEIET